MGLSSSQARLLHLTSRMHQIEHKAAKVQAEKLQLANASTRVREEYLNSLEESRIQYSRLASDGSVEFRNASANILQNGVIPEYSGEHSADPLFLQRQDGRIVITPAVAEAFGISANAHETRTLDEFLTAAGLHQTNEMGTRYIDDPEGTIGSFSPRPNGTVKPYQINNPGAHHYTFDGKVTNSTTTSTVSQPGGTIQANTTYTVSTADELAALFVQLNNSTLEGIRIELDADINLASIPLANQQPNINNVIFDGNGHKISGLAKGTLFNTITNSTIMNLEIIPGTIYVDEGVPRGYIANSVGYNADGTNNNTISNITIDNGSNVNIYNNNNYFGGLVGHVTGGASLAIDNCYVANLTLGSSGSGGQNSGGLVGNNNGTITISNTYVETNSLNGISKILVGNNHGSITVDSNSYWVNSYNGNHNPSGVSDDYSSLANSSDYSGGGVYAGDIPTGAVDADVLLPHNVQVTNANIPKINADGSGAYASNIIAVLTKLNNEVPNETTQNQVKAYLHGLNPENDAELFYLNQYILKYLNNNMTASEASQFTTALLNDITTGTTTATANAGYRTGTTNPPLNTVSRTKGSEWTPQRVNDETITNGSMTIPNIADIRDGIYYAFQIAGEDISLAQINAFLERYDTSDSMDNARLANINDILRTYSSNVGNTSVLQELKSNIENNTMMNQIPSDISAEDIQNDHMTITMQTEANGVNPQPRQIPQSYVVRSYWDQSDPEVARATALWAMARRGVDVLTDEEASSEEYLTNMISCGEAVLTTFNPENVGSLAELSETEILNMTDARYFELLGVVNTSVAIETALREGEFTDNIKKAEAKYEADLKKINAKERKYDRDLATLDNERNAIKQEMDTLKSVAKDNVERTFKLFS